MSNDMDIEGQFLDMVKEQHEMETHKVFPFYLPSKEVLDQMAKYCGGPLCPKCRKGRVMFDIHYGNFGETFHARCHFGDDCDFHEHFFDEA